MNLPEALALSGAGGLLSKLLPKIDKLEEKKAVRVRDLTLNEDFDEYGRLIQMLGTNEPHGTDIEGNPFYGRAYMDADHRRRYNTAPQKCGASST